MGKEAKIEKAVCEYYDKTSKDVNYHPALWLLAIERTGWRRWIFGRWVYSSEPFRRDIQRRCANTEEGPYDATKPWERLFDPGDRTDG